MMGRPRITAGRPIFLVGTADCHRQNRRVAGAIEARTSNETTWREQWLAVQRPMVGEAATNRTACSAFRKNQYV